MSTKPMVVDQFIECDCLVTLYWYGGRQRFGYHVLVAAWEDDQPDDIYEFEGKRFYRGEAADGEDGFWTALAAKLHAKAACRRQQEIKAHGLIQ